MECLSLANFYTRSIPICLKTGGVVMFTISPTLLSVTSSLCRDKKNCLCLLFPPWLLLHCKWWLVSNAWNSIFPADIHLLEVNFLYTKFIIVCCKRIFIRNDQRDVFIIAGYAPTINTSNWTKLKMLIYRRKFSKLAIKLIYENTKILPKYIAYIVPKKNCILRQKKIDLHFFRLALVGGFKTGKIVHLLLLWTE